MTPAELSAALSELVFELVTTKYALAADEARQALEGLQVERPKSRDHGDWASNVALRLAGKAGVSARELADTIVEGAKTLPGVADAQVAGPGFINFRIEAAAAGALARTIVEAGEAFGTSDELAAETINLEFVSGNPTGPLHLAHTRWAAVGDSMARVLKAAGAKVTTEYYINNAGNQMHKFGLSVLAAAKGEPTPEGGYPGEYVGELAQRVLAENPNALQLDDAAALELMQRRAYEMQLDEIKQALADFNVHFDVWFSELSLHAPDPQTGKSAIDEAAERLRAQGHVFDQDDAVWVRTTSFGDDKDRVMVRSNGEYTYFAADAAYYLSKKDRGFEEKIYLLGADHHGYVHRLKAIAGAAGDDPEKNISVLIGQMVTVNGAKLSKRAGNIVELTDLLEWLGADVLRYWLARYPSDTPLDLDGEQLRKRSNDNPVFYVQYAHARTRSVARNAASVGVTREQFEAGALNHETESALLGVLQEFPRIVHQAAELREPHRIARYLEQLAASYHRWYDNCRVTPQGEEPVTALHSSRLWLNDAAGQVLRNGLTLLGVSAPERM